jgi:hypothetical protein
MSVQPALSMLTKAYRKQNNMSTSIIYINNPVGESLNREDQKMAAGTPFYIIKIK